MSAFLFRRLKNMDALAEAIKALEKAKKELFEHDMNLKWELKIDYIDSERIKSTYPPPRPEKCTELSYFLCK
jgi:hypothetical protein